MNRSTFSLRAFLVLSTVLALSPFAAFGGDSEKPTERVKNLIETLKTGSSADRKAAAETLADLKEEALPAVPWLTKVVGMQKPTPLELFSSRVDPSRVAAARAINKIDRSQLKPALMQARQSLSLWAQLWAQQSLDNLNGNPSPAPANDPPAKQFKTLGPLKTLGRPKTLGPLKTLGPTVEPRQQGSSGPQVLVFPQTAQTKSAAFVGTWLRTSFEEFGKQQTVDAGTKMTLKFSKDMKVVYSQNGSVVLEGEFSCCEPTKTAEYARWDWQGQTTDRVTYFFVGDDTLVTCWTHESKEWPTRFATGSAEGGTYLAVWQRVK